MHESVRTVHQCMFMDVKEYVVCACVRVCACSRFSESRVGSATASTFPSGRLVSVLEVGLKVFSSSYSRIFFCSCI